MSNPATNRKTEKAGNSPHSANKGRFSPRAAGYVTTNGEEKKCYADGTRDIPCDNTALASFSEVIQKGMWKREAGWICKTHYDILANLQDKLTFEERQMTKRAGLPLIPKHELIIPDKEWWNMVLLPSYRHETIIKTSKDGWPKSEDNDDDQTGRLPSKNRKRSKKDRARTDTVA